MSTPTTGLNSIEKLLAEKEITQLIIGYSRAIDRAKIDGLRTAEFFTEDAVMEAPGRLEAGLQVFLARQTRDLSEEDPPSQHTVVATVLEVDQEAGTAEALSDFICTELTVEGPRTALAGRYADSLARIDGRWWITHRRVQPLA